LIDYNYDHYQGIVGAEQLCAKGLALGPYTVTAPDEAWTRALRATGRPL